LVSAALHPFVTGNWFVQLTSAAAGRRRRRRGIRADVKDGK